ERDEREDRDDEGHMAVRDRCRLSDPRHAALPFTPYHGRPKTESPEQAKSFERARRRCPDEAYRKRAATRHENLDTRDSIRAADRYSVALEATHMTTRMSIVSCIVASSLAGAMFSMQSPSLLADALKCDMTQYKAGTGLTA